MTQHTDGMWARSSDNPLNTVAATANLLMLKPSSYFHKKSQRYKIATKCQSQICSKSGFMLSFKETFLIFYCCNYNTIKKLLKTYILNTTFGIYFIYENFDKRSFENSESLCTASRLHFLRLKIKCCT